MVASKDRCPVKSTYSALYQHFIKGLRAQRKAKGVSQADLADRLGGGQSFISKIERGERRLDIAEFVTVAQAIGMEPVQLFGKLFHSFPTEPAQPKKRLQLRNRSKQGSDKH